MQRIAVIGVSGVGKSIFAVALAHRLGFRYIEADRFHWELGWVAAAKPVRRELIAAAITADTWVFDGNVEFARDLVWTRADTIIWLDYPLPVILWRVCRRNLCLAWTRAELWNGNHMTWRFALSRVHHALTSYRKKRTSFAYHLAAYPKVHVLRFRSHRPAGRWLQHANQHRL